MLPRSALMLAIAVLPLAGMLCPAGAQAQTSPSESDAVAPAHVSRVEGSVTLEREGRTENAPLNMPLLTGDRLKTVDGRAEVLFGDGSALHIDSRSTLDMQSDELMRLIDGRLRLNMVGPARTVSFRIDSPAGSVRITQPGEYRVSMLRRQEEVQLELAVIRGGGEIFTDEGKTDVRAGERAYASAGLMPSYAYSYNSASWDTFDRWSESLRSTRLSASSQYLPEDVRTYSSTFDEYGDWRYEPTYGNVWYPRVATGWRPYYNGRWVSYPRYGWTWVGADTFAWPTHHYGRWGLNAGVWFWIPAARWAPAHVSWGYAPGYVSWCPLGWNNRAVIGVDVFRVGPGYYSSPYAWTLVSNSHFGRDYYVHHRAVDWRRFDNGGRPHIEPRASAPGYRQVDGRNAAPILRAGSRTPPDGTRATIDGTRTPSAGTRVGYNTGLRSPSAATPSAATPSAANASSAPRYINRGNEIVQSRTERPSAPASAARAVPRNGDSPRLNGDSPRFDSPARPGNGDSPHFTDRATPGNGDNPNFRGATVPQNGDSPRLGQRAQPRNGDSPRSEPARVESPAYRPRYDPAPAPSAAPPAAARERQVPAPAARERQAPPPQRSAPAAERPAAGGERAVPREAPRNGGPASAPAMRTGGRRGGGV